MRMHAALSLPAVNDRGFLRKLMKIKILPNTHLYRTDANGAARTDTPDLASVSNPSLVAAQTPAVRTAWQQKQSVRERYRFRSITSKFGFVITKNVANPLGAQAAQEPSGSNAPLSVPGPPPLRQDLETPFPPPVEAQLAGDDTASNPPAVSLAPEPRVPAAAPFPQSGNTTQAKASHGHSSPDEDMSAPHDVLPPDGPEHRKVFAANPRLEKITKGGQQRYWLDGMPLARSYAVKKEGHWLASSAIGASAASSITSRKNPKSPFYKKLMATDKAEWPLTPLSAADVKRITNTTNNIARLALSDDLLQKHLAVEVVTKVSNSQVTFITPSVPGYSLETYIGDPARDNEQIDRLISQLDELHKVMVKLAEGGHFHADITAGNIMYDTTSNAMVLIDFEKARVITANSPRSQRLSQRLLAKDIQDLGYVKRELEKAKHPANPS
jgi:hypothetical protein